MWFTKAKLLEVLQNEQLTQKNKEEFLEKNKKRIKNEIILLSPEELITYLFFSNIPKEAKILISDYIDKLSKLNNTIFNKKFRQTKEVFLKSDLINENFIKSDYCPKQFKKIIIDELYNDKIVELISQKTLSTKIKKEIIDLGITFEQTISLLNTKSLQSNIIDYLISTRINTEDEIRKAIKEVGLESSLEKIIIRKITMKNILPITKWIYGEKYKLIYKLKARECEDYIKSIPERKLLSLIIESNMTEDFAKKIYKERISSIPNAIKKADLLTLRFIISLERVPELVPQIINLRRGTVKLILNCLSPGDLFYWLDLEYLPLEFKEYILKIHKRELSYRINTMSPFYIRTEVLKKNSRIPRDVVERTFNKRKEDLIKEILERDESNILSDLRFGGYILEYQKLIIDYRINQNNIYEVLSGYGTEDLIDYVLETKNNIFRVVIKRLEIEEIKRFRIKAIPKDIANRILEKNTDLILPKLEKLKNNELLELLSDTSVHATIKKLALLKFNISEQEIDNCLCLISKSDPQLVLDYYEKIKELITSMGINFQSFIQYGSGSTKHPDWLNNFINIIKNNKIEEFKQCKEYFFRNYYEKEENIVYTISSFLEIIDNFCKYEKICIKLKNNNTKLTKNDKSNIRFLFNINNIITMQLPDSLEELSHFKQNLYKDYIKRIENNFISNIEIKNIFNDLLFCNSNNIFEYIGGSGALRTIKKDNANDIIINELACELMMYSNIIEMVNDTNNYDGLRKLLIYIFSDIDILTKFQNMFSDVERKIVKLYELDSINNLSKISEARKIKGIINEELSNKYGGEVFDYSNKNYCLYAHVLSSRENIEDIIKGTSTGKSNFISVSPISYRGQKYYYNRSNIIIAYDTIPTGNFICSSVTNMGSNYSIKANSSEVASINRCQRGILETSAVIKNNSEALLYRENLIPCGLILPGGREPTKEELEYHQKYGLPFIITQEITTPITDPQMVFNQEQPETRKYGNKELQNIIDILTPNLTISKETEEYTGREIAIFTDCHSMFEPTLAILEDIRRHGITEIYSLGDNVGLGPSPCETFDLLEDYGVISVAGNSEYYNTLGIEPFDYFTKEKQENQEWTASKLGASRISKIKLFPASIDLTIGDKKVALCHFANDVRWNFQERSTHTYQNKFVKGINCRQFLYTNSDEAKKKIGNCIVTNKKNISKIKGYLSAQNEPIFGGKLVTSYDSIIQGHVHFDMEDKLEDTEIYTLRAVGIGYDNSKEKNKACYYVLKEKKDGTFDIQKKLIEFNRNNLLSNIYTSGLPHKDKLLQYVKA